MNLEADGISHIWNNRSYFTYQQILTHINLNIIVDGSNSGRVDNLGIDLDTIPKPYFLEIVVHSFGPRIRVCLSLVHPGPSARQKMHDSLVSTPASWHSRRKDGNKRVDDTLLGKKNMVSPTIAGTNLSRWCSELPVRWDMLVSSLDDIQTQLNVWNLYYPP